MEKKCEFVFSGKEQIVSPLVPKEINERNLNEGIKELIKGFKVKGLKIKNNY